MTATGRPRIGIFGGTFDPPHIGHLVSAIAARDALRLDRVLLVVANRPWQKVGDRSISGAAARLAMVRAAVHGLDRLEASDIEIIRGGDSYTIETIQQLRHDEPSASLHLIVGGDAALGLPTWERATELASLAELVVIDRPGSAALEGDGTRPAPTAAGEVTIAPGVTWPATRVEAPRLEVSSTDLRARARDGRSLDLLTPVDVVTLIHTRGIYRGAP